MPSKADRMRLLTELEEVRERHRAAEFHASARANAEAAAAAQAAAREHLETRRHRQTFLSQSYAAIIGLRPIIDVQDLRAVEQALAERQEAARTAQENAEAAARQASAACDQARAALHAVSHRKTRRGRLADLFKSQESRIAMMAEEQSVADELMDRFRGDVVT